MRTLLGFALIPVIVASLPACRESEDSDDEAPKVNVSWVDVEPPRDDEDARIGKRVSIQFDAFLEEDESFAFSVLATSIDGKERRRPEVLFDLVIISDASIIISCSDEGCWYGEDVSFEVPPEMASFTFIAKGFIRVDGRDIQEVETEPFFVDLTL